MRMIAKFRCGGEWEISIMPSTRLPDASYVQFKGDKTFGAHYFDNGRISPAEGNKAVKNPFDIIDVELVP